MRTLARSNRFTHIGALCAFACLLTSWSAASSQQTTADPAVKADSPTPMAFDKVVMFPDTREDPASGGILWWDRASDNAWGFDNVSSSNLIANAYGLGMHQVIGLPRWAETDRYGLLANMGADKFQEFEKLPADEQLRQQRLMTQAVLAVRYQVKAHRETRELPVYELVVANGGMKIAETDLDGHSGYYVLKPGDWWYDGTMEDLACKLAGPSGGIVVDKTGLGTMRFHYHFKWSPDELSGAADRGLSISAALDEQLGLKLVRATDPVEVLVIDHIEKPKTGFWATGFGPPSGSSR